ncbi:hypothetical protein ILYODFUR_021447 [Ilyodon furcidens]|uniref:Uncharacterized protein n=1 Tax=Ilyodon furcidens TaxID=33524 RepID=A0ABV0U7K2_9TELE
MKTRSPVQELQMKPLQLSKVTEIRKFLRGWKLIPVSVHPLTSPTSCGALEKVYWKTPGPVIQKTSLRVFWMTLRQSRRRAERTAF